MPNHHGIGCVILGAGFSRRFGADKRTQSLGSLTVAQTTLQTYCTVFSEVRLVLREEDDGQHIAGEQLRQKNLHLVRTPLAHLGMGHSLSAGFNDLPWRWSFVALLDMPYVRPATLQALIDHAMDSSSKLVQPRLVSATTATQERSHGHPIGIHCSLFEQIRASTGDQGARQLIKQYRDEIAYLDCEDPGVIQDIDQPSDLIKPC